MKGRAPYKKYAGGMEEVKRWKTLGGIHVSS